METARENNILFRRFIVVTIAIATIGVMLSQVIVATHRSGAEFTVHNRAIEWEQQGSKTPCIDIHCRFDTGVSASA